MNVIASPTRAQPPLLYKRIKQQLLRRIGKDWTVGSRLPSIDALSTQLKTGRSNTWRAMHELVQEGVLASRARSGTYVAQIPKASQSEQTLAGRAVLIAYTPADPFTLQAVTSATEILEPMGARIRWIDYGRFGGKHVAESEALMLVNPDTQARPLVEGRSAVIIDTAHYDAPPSGPPHDVVTVNSEQGGYLAGCRMREIECESVALLGVWKDDGPMEATCAARVKGFESGYGKKLDEQHLLRSDSYMTVQGANRVREWLALSPRPKGIFAASDDLAVGFVHGALAHGLQPGVDYQIIGFDGQARGQELPSGSLSTVEVPMAAMGRKAARLLVDRINHPDDPPQLVTLGVQFHNGTTAVADKE